MTLQGQNVTWQFQVTVHVIFMGMPPPQEDDDSNTCSVQLENLVVTSGTDVLFHHVSDTHQISWNIDHKAITGWQFTVTVAVINTVGGATVRTLQTTQTGIGNGNSTWDGKNEMGQDAGAGVYAYKVTAQDIAECMDQDKSGYLTATITDDRFYWVGKNPATGKLRVMARYTLSRSAADCTLRFYGPDLTVLGELTGQPCAAGTQWSAMKEIDGLDAQGNPLQPLYCVIWATEDAATAALNRGQEAKQALQRGATTLEHLELGLIAATFTGEPNKCWSVYRDNGKGAYGTPQWQDNTSPLDRDADDGDEDPDVQPPPGQQYSDHKYPVSYVQNSKMTVAVSIKIPNWLITGDVQIKGAGPDNLSFATTAATVTDGVASATIQCAIAFAQNQVKDYAAVNIQWSISGDSGATWIDAGTCDNEVFVTLTVSGASKDYRTVLHLATVNGGSNADTCASNTWNAFAGPANVKAWDKAQKAYARPLYYYHSRYATATSTATLLADADGDGQCHAWEHLLRQAFLVNSVAATSNRWPPRTGWAGTTTTPLASRTSSMDSLPSPATTSRMPKTTWSTRR